MEKKTEMKFTIVTPTYNCKSNIEISFNSVVNQKISEDIDFEYIFKDGKSSDGTVEEIERLKNSLDDCLQSKIKIISEKDEGIYDAMNKSIAHITGDYVLFLGAGDYLLDNVFERVSEALSANNNPDVIYGYIVLGENHTPEVRKINLKYTFRLMPVCHQAIFAKTELLKEKCFDTKYKAVADQDWIMAMVKKKKTICFIDIPIAFYEANGFSNNQDSLNQSIQDLKEIHKKNYPVRRLIYQLAYFVTHKGKWYAI